MHMTYPAGEYETDGMEIERVGGSQLYPLPYREKRGQQHLDECNTRAVLRLQRIGDILWYTCSSHFVS